MPWLEWLLIGSGRAGSICLFRRAGRQKVLDWLRWDEDEDKEAEPSANTLTLNCPMVYCMFENLQQLSLVSISRLSKTAT